MRVYAFDLMPWPHLDEASYYPDPNAKFDPVRGQAVYAEHLDQMVLCEELGFDAIGINEHHAKPYGLMPSPNLIAAALTQRTRRIKIALLGNLPALHAHPVRLAEEIAMLDVMSGGRIISGFVRGVPQEYLALGGSLPESRERLDEAWELVVRAWTTREPFPWQGKHFQYDRVSIWPRPLQQPHPPTYALGTSRESCDFAARNHLGCGVSYGSFESVGRATRYYREQCAHYGWTPTPEQIVYRANMLLAETDDEAEAQFRQLPNQRPFTMRPGVTDALNKLDSRNIAGQSRAPIVGGALPTTFVGGPDTVVEQVRRCRDEVGAGVLDLSLHPPGSGDLDPLMRALDLFGTKVLPRIRDI